MATLNRIVHLGQVREGHLALLADHAEQPDGSCACGDPQHPCIWALAALLDLDRCDRRINEIEAGLIYAAQSSPLALTRLVDELAAA